MAKFTRAEIRNILGEACTEEIENRLVALHLGVVDPLKDDLTKYKADAEKLPGVQKQLDDLKAAGDGGYKEKYEKEHSAFEAFKTDITAKESKAAKEKAVRAYFESKNITGANLDLAMRGCGEEMAALELDGEKIKDTKSLDALVDGTYKGLVSKQTVRFDTGARFNGGGNPLDVADYLASANITLQTAFGMTYVENFLGLGTVILNSSVPKGKIYATAKDNIVLYYIPVNGADLGEVFDFTTDATGYIGIHEEPDYTNMTASDTVINGMALFAERIDGVVVGSITPAVGG